MAPSKRKAPAKPRPRKSKAAKLGPSLTDVKPFRLMDLAPELRIVVYEKVLENYPTARLSRNSKRHELASTSVLPRVSKQVRDDFLSVLTTSVSEISTVVTNFNFRHIVTFLNRLSTVELEKMTCANASRILRITLEFSLKAEERWVLDLQRWLNRAQHPSKHGSTIDFQYVSDKGHEGQMGALTLSYRPIGTSLEAVKIRSALL